jgi:glycosyltransferase involved in cell wall biosynthesis
MRYLLYIIFVFFITRAVLLYFGFLLITAKCNRVRADTFSKYTSVENIIVYKLDGILVKPFDIEEYSEQLSILMRNSVLRTQLSENAIKSAQRFALQNVIDKWEVLFQDLKINAKRIG